MCRRGLKLCDIVGPMRWYACMLREFNLVDCPYLGIIDAICLLSIVLVSSTRRRGRRRPEPQRSHVMYAIEVISKESYQDWEVECYVAPRSSSSTWLTCLADLDVLYTACG
jgi:hypothetical protein